MHKPYILLFVATILASCSMEKSDPTDDSALDSPVHLTEDQKTHLYHDTITPPSNPLVPPTENTYTMLGRLDVVYQVGNRAARPALRSLQNNTSYKLYRDNHFAYFNDPLLQGLRIGDTISVTGDVMIDGAWRNYILQMQEVHLVAPTQERQEGQP